MTNGQVSALSTSTLLVGIDCSERGKEKEKMSWFWRKSIWVIAVPVLLAVIFYQLESFEPAHLPIHEFDLQSVIAPGRKLNILQGAEKVGTGKLTGPEDVAYDAESNHIYTGCDDGWIKRVRLHDLAVEDWVDSGGRPLGIVFGPDKRLIVADANRGLLSVDENKKIELLTEEADGVKFGLTDGVDVTDQGTMIYFTDASYKYTLKDFIWDMLEGTPNGRLLSYDRSTNQTIVLLSNLYFPNGVSLSHDQTFLVFCETQMRRCRKYVISGERKGSVEKFIEIDGFPDNIRYDRVEGVYWIGLTSGVSFIWDVAQRYPLIRKVLGMIHKYKIGLLPNMKKDGGLLAVDKDGKLMAYYSDSGLSSVSSGLKIGDHLYFGSLRKDYLLRVNMTQCRVVGAD